MVKTKTKGRDSELIRNRNQKLIERYYFWSEIKRIRHDDVLSILSKVEFFISEQRIMVLLRENQNILDELFEKNTNKNQLKLFNDGKNNK